MNSALVGQIFNIVDSLVFDTLEKHKGRVGRAERIELFNMLSEHFDTHAAKEDETQPATTRKGK